MRIAAIQQIAERKGSYTVEDLEWLAEAGSRAKWTRDSASVEAFQWAGATGRRDLPSWLAKQIREKSIIVQQMQEDDAVLVIEGRPAGSREVRRGDYIIRSLSGSVYPCPAEVFTETFEAL